MIKNGKIILKTDYVLKDALEIAKDYYVLCSDLNKTTYSKNLAEGCVKDNDEK